MKTDLLVESSSQVETESSLSSIGSRTLFTQGAESKMAAGAACRYAEAGKRGATCPRWAVARRGGPGSRCAPKEGRSAAICARKARKPASPSYTAQMCPRGDDAAGSGTVTQLRRPPSDGGARHRQRGKDDCLRARARLEGGNRLETMVAGGQAGGDGIGSNIWFGTNLSAMVRDRSIRACC